MVWWLTFLKTLFLSTKGFIIGIVLFLIRNPLKVGLIILGIYFLFSLNACWQDQSWNPMINYFGRLVVGNDNRISQGLIKLEAEELSTYDKLEVWLGIGLAIHVFVMIVWFFYKFFIARHGTTTSPIWALIDVLFVIFLLSAVVIMHDGGELQNPVQGFTDLIKYILDHEAWFMNYLNQTGYSPNGSLELNVTPGV